MKQLLCSFLILLLTSCTIICFAQNSIQIDYGARLPKGEQLRAAFKPGEGYGISFMHQNKGEWGYGITIDHQRLYTDKNYFNDDYSSDMNLTNFLFTLRKNFHLKEDHRWYLALDGGLNYNDLRWSKNNIEDRNKNNGLTTGFVLGTDWSITKQLSFDLSGAYHYSYTDDVLYDNRFALSTFKYWNINLGIRYIFVR